MVFQNRVEAARKLASKLQAHQGKKGLVVLAIPRGGVVTGQELARALSCPLEVIVTKKIGAPGNPELAIGAVGPIGQPVIDENLVQRLGIKEDYLQKQTTKIKEEIRRREKEFRGDKPPFELKNKTVILTDDGVATGATILAAIEIVRQENPKRIIVAIPVIARDSLVKVEAKADEVVYLEAPKLFFAVGQFYREFPQVSDEEVKDLLK